MCDKLNIGLYNTYLKYYLSISNPDDLTDEDWAAELQNLHFIKQKEKESTQYQQ